ncbi:MAG: hypothetical protein OEV48_05210 [Acidobacteriota bacterium]|nr:hypothetical protein [Acidobacteriota bacterium]
MSQVLVGLHRVGIVGLRQACEKVAAVGLAGRQEIVDFLLSELGADNFIPVGQEEAFRTALWREYLRFVGGDFSEFFSEIEVTVGGEPGENRDSLVERCTLVLAEFELRPVVDLAGANQGGGPDPELVIGGTTVARGLPSRKSLRATIRQRLSDW